MDHIEKRIQEQYEKVILESKKRSSPENLSEVEPTAKKPKV